VKSFVRVPETAALYECRVTHSRRAPIRNAFRYRTCQWLFDAADPPRLGPFASFRPRDHLGDPRLPIADNVRAYLSASGIDGAPGPIRMLTTPRALGCVFNPLTVYWCYRRNGELQCVLAEVHNTYGQRHVYLLHPDQDGRASAVKEFYVSPFYPVAGSYQMSLPEPGDRLALAITYRPPAGPPFTAAITGRARRLTPAAAVLAAVRHPVPGLLTAARIRRQGLGLYARGLRPLPRPQPAPQEVKR
jgi:uncharacterized protein